MCELGRRWLLATLQERATDLGGSIDAIAAAVKGAKQSKSLEKILSTVLACSNFLNHGSARANVAGVKVSSLRKLAQTRCTKSDHHQDLLAFVVKHSGVSAAELRAELPTTTLAAASQVLRVSNSTCGV